MMIFVAMQKGGRMSNLEMVATILSGMAMILCFIATGIIYERGNIVGSFINFIIGFMNMMLFVMNMSR